VRPSVITHGLTHAKERRKKRGRQPSYLSKILMCPLQVFLVLWRLLRAPIEKEGGKRRKARSLQFSSARHHTIYLFLPFYIRRASHGGGVGGEVRQSKCTCECIRGPTSISRFFSSSLKPFWRIAARNRIQPQNQKEKRMLREKERGGGKRGKGSHGAQWRILPSLLCMRTLPPAAQHQSRKSDLGCSEGRKGVGRAWMPRACNSYPSCSITPLFFTAPRARKVMARNEKNGAVAIHERRKRRGNAAASSLNNSRIIMKDIYVCCFPFSRTILASGTSKKRD